MSISISLCMIVKDEENNLKYCLESAKNVADEIIIVDTGSADKTIEIASRYTNRIYSFNWIDDFAAARNFSFLKATMDYILWLDGDDILTPENNSKLLQLKEGLAWDVDYVIMPYNYSHDENGNVITRITRERLVKRSNGFKWRGAVHETLCVSGNGAHSDIYITHNHSDAKCEKGIPDASFTRNFQILKKVFESGEPEWRDYYYYGTSLYDMGKYDEALDVLMHLFALPNHGLTIGTDAYISAYRIYLKKGDKKSALKILTDNAGILEDKSEYYCALGDFYLHEVKQFDMARRCYSRALNCGGNDRPGFFVERNESFYYFIPLNKLGLLFFELEMYVEALSFFEKSLIYNPRHETTLAVIKSLKKLLSKNESVRYINCK